MLDVVVMSVAVFLLLTLLAGLVRAARGPSTRDRLTSLLLVGTTGVALLAVLAEVTDEPALRDGAVLVVALAALVVVVQVRTDASAQPPDGTAGTAGAAGTAPDDGR